MKYKWMGRFLAFVCALVVGMTAVPMQAEAIGAESAIAVGVDVSKYQGAIDWGALAAQGVSFAFVKVGSAKSGVDPYFDYNMRAASAAGLRTGAYIYSYATSVEGAVAEANWVLSMLDPYPVSFPVVFDIEDNVQKALDPGTLSLMSNAFCTVIEEAGYYPMVYSGRNFFRDRLPFVAYDRWVAQYAGALEYEGASIWQATSKAQLAGINGNVDLNYLFKDYTSLIIPYGWLPRKGAFYFYENWKLKKGWISFNGATYYSDELGRMITGWQKLDEEGIRYFRNDGIMSVGFAKVDEKNYYFNEKGYMQTGLQDIGGFKFLFGADGVMYTGWQNDGVHTRYFMENGAMAVALQKIGDSYYYFDGDGYMQVGFVNINGYTFYFDATGVLQKGWVTDASGRYYFNPVNGAMVTNWQNIDGTYYYFGTDGKLGSYQWVDAGNGQKFFADLDGSLTKGWKQIDGKVYLFADNGLLVTNTQIVVNGVLYQLDATGAATALGPVGAVPTVATQAVSATQ